MKVKLLRKDYKKNDHLYEAFIDGSIIEDDSFFSDEVVSLLDAPDFPIYMGKGSQAKRKKDFLKAFRIISETYIKEEREIIFDERFWHSLFITEKREYVIHHYPQVLDSKSNFNNIVLKKFDWENYIYKCLMAVEYIEDSTDLILSKERYYELIFENLDVYNYVIKYPVFRNNSFLIKILTIIEELDISADLKAKIESRPDLGKDERYGRRVIFELNKNYPIMMVPLMDIESLKDECVKALHYYGIEVS